MTKLRIIYIIANVTVIGLVATQSIDPVLDPGRVLATAETMGWGRVLAVGGSIKPPNARPYQLKEAGE